MGNAAESKILAPATTGTGMTQAHIRFGVPDLSLPASERGLFSFPANKTVVENITPLHDARTDPDVIKGPAGLDVQGFAYVNHRSALADSGRWFEGQDIEEVYLPEVCDLVCRVTGAKSAVAINTAFRRKTVELQNDPSFVLKKGEPLDQELAKLPRDQVLVYGKEKGGSLEPARLAHIDYSVKGLRSTVRYCRKDISATGKEYLDGEKAGSATTDLPRIAAYTVWRPVETVRRDPLVVCDSRTLDNAELQSFPYRCPSETNTNGEYMMDAYGVLPPNDPGSQRWCWMPHQTPDEVLIAKFADTQAEKDPNVALGCPHCSPHIPGTEEEEARVSIETRVIAFW